METKVKKSRNLSIENFIGIHIIMVVTYLWIKIRNEWEQIKI